MAIPGPGLSRGSGILRRGWGFIQPDELQRENHHELPKTLDAAMLMGATLVTFHPSSIEGEMTQARRDICTQETLRDLSGYAEDRCKIAIENFPAVLWL